MKNLVGATLGQYEIKEQIGRGGMAYVFRAYQPSLDRFVAVKVLSSTLAEEPGFTERFQREARAVARLHHPNILSVYDFGVQDDYTYIAMHYVKDSKTLRDLMRDGAPLDDLVDYIIQVASALSYAHKQGIIHRDVKPSNILIDGEWALLSDFGLVKMTTSASQLTGTNILGTPAYMSPEQVTGKDVDHRTDIYALGIILHKVLTGTIPHDAPIPMAILHRRSSEPVSPLREIKPDVPESLEHVTLRSLATTPDARYSTAIDFADALKQAKTDPGYREDTITGIEDATIVSGAKPLAKRRNMGLIAGAVVAVVVVIAGVLALLWWFLLKGAPSTTQAETSGTAGEVSAVMPSTDTPIPPPDTPVPPGTPSALAKTRLKVQSGPGDEYDLLGYLPQGAGAEITSQDESGQWWQIKTSLTAAGMGWIRADFSEATDAGNVPIALPPTPTDTPTPVPDTPTPTATPIPDTPTPTSTASPTRLASTATPTPPPTAIKAPVVPAGQFTLLKPVVDEPTAGETVFEWQWGSPLAESQGFEVRVWQDGESPAGIHNSVLDNQDGTVQALGDNTYRLVANIADTPGVRNRQGEYNWTVILIQIEPEYKELGIQADPPGHLRFEPPGGGSDDDDGGGGGGGGGTSI